MGIEKYFDLWADDYGNLPDENSFHIRWMGNEICRRVDKRKNLNILDLGVGGGRLSLALNFRDSFFIGIDLSEKQLGLTRTRFEDRGVSYRLMKQDLEEALPVEESSIDLVVSNATIHHIKDKGKIIREVYRILKERGKFIFFDFYFGVLHEDYKRLVSKIEEKNPNDAKEFIRSIKTEHLLMPDHLERSHPEEFHVHPSELKCLMERTGFQKCGWIETYYHKCVGLYGEKPEIL